MNPALTSAGDEDKLAKLKRGEVTVRPEELPKPGYAKFNNLYANMNLGLGFHENNGLR